MRDAAMWTVVANLHGVEAERSIYMTISSTNASSVACQNLRRTHFTPTTLFDRDDFWPTRLYSFLLEIEGPRASDGSSSTFAAKMREISAVIDVRVQERR
jgi:hypothetical protein